MVYRGLTRYLSYIDVGFRIVLKNFEFSVNTVNMSLPFVVIAFMNTCSSSIFMENFIYSPE